MSQVQCSNTKPSVWEVIKSVLAAMIGIQKNQTRERDFTHGNPWMFIVVGVVLVALFVLVLFLAVKWVIATSL